MQTLSRRGRVSDGGQMTFPFLKVTKFPNDVLFFHRISLHLCKEIIFFLGSCDISLPCGAIADSMKWEGVLFK